MVAAALADILTDFGQPDRRLSRFAGKAQAIPSADRPGPAAPVGPDIDALLADERRKAEAEITARLEGSFQARLVSEREAYAREKEEMLAASGQEMAGRMLERLDEMEDRLIALTGASTARILGSIVSDEIRKRSIEELARTIRQAASDDEAVRIRVKGPQTLFAALAANLDDWAVHLEHIESAETDITVDINETIFETRLAEWSASLMEALS
jgi:hypothetical protein